MSLEKASSHFYDSTATILLFNSQWQLIYASRSGEALSIATGLRNYIAPSCRKCNHSRS